jgi:hypothetical protein
MRLTIKDVIRLQKKSGSKARGRSFDSPDARCRLNSGFWASRRNKPQLGVYAACLYSRIGRNLTTSSRKKVNHEMAPERFS